MMASVVQTSSLWPYPFFAPAVRREIINWHFDALPFLQLSENVDQQLKVEGVGVVKVILVLGCKLLLFCVQHLPHKDTADSWCWEKTLLSSIRRVREKNMHTSTTAASLSLALIGWFGQMARLLKASGLLLGVSECSVTLQQRGRQEGCRVEPTTLSGSRG